MTALFRCHLPTSSLSETTMIRAKAFLPFVLMSLLVVSACDNDGSSNNNNNNGKSFNATVSGDRSESFGGSALAVESHDATSGDVSWVSASAISTPVSR